MNTIDLNIQISNYKEKWKKGHKHTIWRLYTCTSGQPDNYYFNFFGGGVNTCSISKCEIYNNCW